MKNSIEDNLQGGFGNQLFQILYARLLQSKPSALIINTWLLDKYPTSYCYELPSIFTPDFFSDSIEFRHRPLPPLSRYRLVKLISKLPHHDCYIKYLLASLIQSLTIKVFMLMPNRAMRKQRQVASICARFFFASPLLQSSLEFLFGVAPQHLQIKVL